MSKMCSKLYISIYFFPGAFELAIIRMSRYFDLSQNAVLFMNCMLPMEAFMNNRDTTEMKLVSQIFDFAKSIAEMRLSDVALALYSAYILLQEGKSYYNYDFVLTQLCEIILMTIFFLSFFRPTKFKKRWRSSETFRSSSWSIATRINKESPKCPNQRWCLYFESASKQTWGPQVSLIISMKRKKW